MTFDDKSACDKWQLNHEHDAVNVFRSFFINTNHDMMIAAVLTLGEVLRRASPTSSTSLFAYMRITVDDLIKYMFEGTTMAELRQEAASKRLTPLPLMAALEIFQQFARRLYEDHPHVTPLRLQELLVQQAVTFRQQYTRARTRLARIGGLMIQSDQANILTHGRSACVEELIDYVVTVQHRRLSLIVSKHMGVPEDVESMNSWSAGLKNIGVPTRFIDVTDAGNIMSTISFVVVGAEAVTEDGGIINRAGTSVLASLAAAQHKPLYVICEAAKFTKIKPLDSDDLETMNRRLMDPSTVREQTCNETHQGLVDWTHPDLISLLFTDLGVFTPAGVADELSHLYQRGV